MTHKNPTCSLRRIMAILLVTMIPLGPALADMYTIKLYPTAGPGGTGMFNFQNPGTTTCHIANGPSLMTTDGAMTVFNQSEGFCVEVAAVDYNDGKIDAEYGANQITGNYVEGLGGALATSDGASRIVFSFTASGTDPSGFSKTYVISGSIAGSGRYSVANDASASDVPEPGILALISVGIAALGFATRRKRKPAANR